MKNDERVSPIVCIAEARRTVTCERNVRNTVCIGENSWCWTIKRLSGLKVFKEILDGAFIR